MNVTIFDNELNIVKFNSDDLQLNKYPTIIKLEIIKYQLEVFSEKPDLITSSGENVITSS